MNKTIDLSDPSYYINREIGLLRFQERVLEEARDKDYPLLERTKFISILGSNLEEFFMVRVGGLKMQTQEGIVELSIDGLTPTQQLVEIRKHSLKIMKEARMYLQDELMPDLENEGIRLLAYEKLNNKQKETADRYFDDVVFPVLTPLAFDPGHPFPFISNLSLNLAVLVRGNQNETHFARVKVPTTLTQLVPLTKTAGILKKDGSVSHKHDFVWLHELIRANLGKLFPGMAIVEAHPFQVIRNADFEIQEIEAGDLLETMEENVRKRRFGQVVRLMINEGMPEHIKAILAENLNVEQDTIYPVNGPLDLVSFNELGRIDRYDLKLKPHIPSTPEILQSSPEQPTDDIFYKIRKKNLMLHHPYESFTPVVNFLRTAARDPNVLAIKQTLYRVGSNSPVVKALMEARRDYGKQVAVLVELKARFDEKSNINWAKQLEEEGVHVTYGLLGLKTHSKIAMVIRKEGDVIRRYVHLGTGNYNHITAQLYEDIGMFTSDEKIGEDATDLFNYLTGYSLKKDYQKLLVAPINLRENISRLIDQEIKQHQSGKQGRIIIKANSIVDKKLIQKLYTASQAGVKVDLLIRGICCLRPGIPDVSENITVISILGRFLEHSRIYYFENDGKPIIHLGSADLMPRNLDRRVEVLFPIEDERLQTRIREEILETYLNDNSKARLMQPDGTYVRKERGEGENIVNAQERLTQLAKARK